MSVLRYDAATADWVIFAPSRRLRPQTAERRDASPAAPPPSQLCPFCPGNEALTPPEVFAVRDRSEPNTPGWKVRVVPNKFPALRIEEEHRRISEGETLRFMGGCGAHEVVIDSPEHDAPAPSRSSRSSFSCAPCRHATTT